MTVSLYVLPEGAGIVDMTISTEKDVWRPHVGMKDTQLFQPRYSIDKLA